MRLNPLRLWSVEFLLRWRRYMSLASVMRYRNYRIREAANSLNESSLLHFSMKQPISGELWLREVGTDISTFEEIVVNQVYGQLVHPTTKVNYIIDLGANIGLAARFFSTAYPDAKILCVEPSSSNVEILKRNTGSFELDGRVRILHAALWHSSSRVSVSGPPRRGEYNSIQVLERTEGAEESVAGLPMARIFAEAGFPHVDLLKVDVEGAEAHLFTGDTSWLNRVETLAVEFHGDSRTQCKFDEILGSSGFTIDDSDAHTVVARRTQRANAN
jgi:FkbM family methyltransferase